MHEHLSVAEFNSASIRFLDQLWSKKTFVQVSYTKADKGFPVRQSLSVCKPESPCVRKTLWPVGSAQVGS